MESLRGAALDVVLSVTDDEVRLAGPGVDVSAPRYEVPPGLGNAVREVYRERGRLSRDTRDLVPVEPRPGLVSLRRAGRLLAEAFLPEPVAGGLRELVERASRQTVALRIAVDAPQLSALPWEALPDPVTGTPLALHPRVSVYRRYDNPTPVQWAGPLRIVVAIASPDEGGGPLLDYERELRAVLRAVREARRCDARVSVVPFGTTAAIREALDVEGGVHVLHISAHGVPGRLILEDEQGRARTVTAAQLADEAIPNGKMPPVVSLAACYTDAEGGEGGASFAAQLAQRGAGAVIGTQTSVTDRYATLVFARIYRELAANARTDLVAAVADARRATQRELAQSADTAERLLAGLDEWGVVTVLASAPEVAVIDRTRPEAPAPVVRTPVWGRLQARPVGQFVGRRRLQRELPAALRGSAYAGLVLHGIGGVGKSTLTAEVLHRTTQREPAWRVATLAGAVTVDDVLAEVARAARLELFRRRAPRREAVRVAGAGDVPWRDRFALLREDVLDDIPILVVLDNFEDNLVAAGAVWRIADAELAELLATWLGSPGRSRLILTSRYPVDWPAAVVRRVLSQPVGPLSAAETGKLLWSLPNIDRHAATDAGTDEIWRLVGGHPRALEYLDALLDPDGPGLGEITDRLTTAVTAGLGPRRAADWLGEKRTMAAALADTVTLIADDVLLTAHLRRLAEAPGAIAALAAISVYRERVPVAALGFHIGAPDSSGRGRIDPGQRAADERRLTEYLEQLGLERSDLHLALEDDGPLTESQRDDLGRLLAPLTADLAPPVLLPDGARDVVRALANSSLVYFDPEDDTVFVHRWTAAELHRLWGADGSVERAHLAAADYWRWRAEANPPGRAVVVHALEEARHHLLTADDLPAALAVTEKLIAYVTMDGGLPRAAVLARDTLRRLPPARRTGRPTSCTSAGPRRPPATTPRRSGPSRRPTRSSNITGIWRTWPRPTTCSDFLPSIAATTRRPSVATASRRPSPSGSARMPTWRSAISSSVASHRSGVTS